MASAPSPYDSLGLPGFTFADLHRPHRLQELYRRFCDDARATDSDLWGQWEQYREIPESLGPIARSNLIVAMAPLVSRFLTRLFGVGAESEALQEATRAYDDLFRFKIDFVRRRALPLLKGGAHITATADDHAWVERLIGGSVQRNFDRLELALARAGCELLDREEAFRAGGSDAEKAAVAADIETLKRWCAAHLHDRRFSSWVIFRFPEPVDPAHLVRIERPNPDLKEVIVGPDDKLRRREGFALTDHRYNTREVLSEIHYCVLCHERDKDTCTKGITDKEGKVTTNALGIPLAGCPLDEKISEMHAVRKRGDAIGALAIVTVDNPMCPGTGHRICN